MFPVINLLRRRHVWLVVGLALLASLFRLAIARYSLWFDEQASMFFASRPLAQLWSGWMVREPNPPLYYALLKLWIMQFGDSDRAVRALSILAGAASIVTTALFARQIYGRDAGLIAAWLTALSAQQLYYSLQVRGYELGYCAASCVLIALVTIERAWRQDRAWTGSLLIYALGCTICIYLHTTMVLLPVIATVAIVVVRRREVMNRPMLLATLMAANVAIVLASGWWLDMTWRQISVGAENSAVFDTVTPWLIAGKSIGILSFAKETGVARTFIAIIFTAIAIGQIRRSWFEPETKLLVAVLGIGIAMFGLISIEVPIFLPRTIFWLSSISTVFCAGGIVAIARRRVRYLVMLSAGALIAVNMATSVAARQTEDWDGAIIRARSLPGARMIVQSEAMGLLLETACTRLGHGDCTVPIIAITTPDDRLDGWSAGLYSGRMIAVAHIDTLPTGRYLVFRKAFYHDLLKTLHQRGRARPIRNDPPLLGPVDRAMLID